MRIGSVSENTPPEVITLIAWAPVRSRVKRKAPRADTAGDQGRDSFAPRAGAREASSPGSRGEARW